MRTARETSSTLRLSDGAWFAAAITLGAVWGFSMEPVPLATGTLASAGLIFPGCMVVAVLCLCLGVMAWL